MRIHKFSGRISVCQTRHRLLLDRSPKLRFSFQSLRNALFSTFLELKKKVNSVEVIVLTALEGKKKEKRNFSVCYQKKKHTVFNLATDRKYVAKSSSSTFPSPYPEIPCR